MDTLKPCSGCKEPNPRSLKGQNYCNACAAAAVRRTRKNYADLPPAAKKRQIARSYLNSYVKRGKVIKPSECSICDSDDRIHGHHEDYDKPLDVVWACHTCHMAIHHT